MSHDARELLPCPFCGERLFLARGRANPYGRCETSGCWMNERKITVPLDDPRQVAAWNTRATLSPMGLLEEVREALEGFDIGPTSIVGANADGLVIQVPVSAIAKAATVLAKLPKLTGEGM